MLRCFLACLRPAPTPDLRAETWRVGELAVCILDHWDQPEAGMPCRGDVLRVASVQEAAAHGVRAYWLGFRGVRHKYVANAFRKPVADDRAADAEFAAQIRRATSSPKRAPAEAPAGARSPLVASEKETARG